MRFVISKHEMKSWKRWKTPLNEIIRPWESLIVPAMSLDKIIPWLSSLVHVYGWPCIWGNSLYRTQCVIQLFSPYLYFRSAVFKFIFPGDRRLPVDSVSCVSNSLVGKMRFFVCYHTVVKENVPLTQLYLSLFVLVSVIDA